MMEQNTFRYHSVSSFSFQTFIPAIASFGLSYYCYEYQAGIRYRSLRVLEYPTSYYVTTLIGVVILVYALYQLIQHGTSSGGDIRLSHDYFTFPKKRESIKVKYDDINQYEFKDDSDDGESVVIYTRTDKKKYQFFHDYFESTKDYLAFKRGIQQARSKEDSDSSQV
ncbi:hypothetical protein [Reichenbachiella versicolor]|uniref:hypothetical protein n=1 Tax=Reichenbachiella versicolor TaxID=1821036 RepID=UPI001C867F14|nr:hypothetical protein [Reichenbachiella versicolor]